MELNYSTNILVFNYSKNQFQYGSIKRINSKEGICLFGVIKLKSSIGLLNCSPIPQTWQFQSRI
jgi:hypothetical protein